MRIDGEDIGKYGASQHNVTMEYSDISNGSEWNTGNLIPLMLPGAVGFKKIKVSVILKEESRKKIWENGRKLVTRLMQPSVVELDGFSNYFYVVLKNVQQAEKSIQRWHKTTLELEGYEYGEEITETTTKTTLTVENPGELETPAMIEILPTIGKTALVITGAARNRFTGEDKPITVKNLFKDMKIVIDGESGVITEDGKNKFQDIELWELPSLKPGTNKITIDQEVAKLTVKFKPRYL